LGSIVRLTGWGFVGGAAIAVVISGCSANHTPAAGTQPDAAPGSNASFSAADTSPPTTGTVTDAADGISITLPAGYTRLLDPAQIQRLLAAGQAELQDMQAQVANLSAAYKQAKIVAIKTPVTGPFASDLTVDVVSAGGSSPNDVAQLLTSASATLTSQGAKITGHSAVSVAGLPALRIDFTVAVGGITVDGTEVYVIYANKLYVTTMGQNDASYDAADVGAVIGSITLT
jgi:hypothetical protein